MTYKDSVVLADWRQHVTLSIENACSEVALPAHTAVFPVPQPEGPDAQQDDPREQLCGPVLLVRRALWLLVPPQVLPGPRSQGGAQELSLPGGVDRGREQLQRAALTLAQAAGGHQEKYK